MGLDPSAHLAAQRIKSRRMARGFLVTSCFWQGSTERSRPFPTKQSIGCKCKIKPKKVFRQSDRRHPKWVPPVAFGNYKCGGHCADSTKTTVCYGIHRRVRPEPRLPGYKPLVFPCGMYSAFPELRRKPLKSYRISCFRVVAARGACYNNGENQPNSVKKSASKPMTDHGRHALWFPLG